MSPKPSVLGPLVKLMRLDFRPESAADAWQRILAFFGEYLQ
jgi:dienelactone hydrolase